MQNIATPGVYIREVSKLPASIAPVATAIPAFVGYTQKRFRDDEEIPVNTPVRITSLLEYEEIFGLPYSESFRITLSDSVENTDEADIGVAPANDELSPYLMHYTLQLYFANGGGPCYVVSVKEDAEGEETDSDGAEQYYVTGAKKQDIQKDDLIAGIDALEQEDEPTLLVVPEAVHLSGEDRKDVYDRMLSQCARLKDRFTLMDVVQSGGKPLEDATSFRNDETGNENLKYGAAYYPALKTTITCFLDEAEVAVTDERGSFDAGPLHGLSLKEVSDGSTYARGLIVIRKNDEIIDDNQKKVKIGDDEYEVVPADTDPLEEGQFIKGASKEGTAANLAAAIGKQDDYEAKKVSDKAVVLITAKKPGEEGESLKLDFTGTKKGIAFLDFDTEDLVDKTELKRVSARKSLYNDIRGELDKKRLTLYPSGAMAGVCARVDRNRGVWKAPANVSLNRVSRPSLILTDEEQAPLNIDPDSGKSVNVIRRFHQKGTIVWGARTLAGNDNEWRYVPVRRLFIFIEESIKKATEPVVFEPNTANTWAKLRGMIENFLTELWRDGALAGAVPEDAFFVKVGLGQTMSANDILEGRLIVEVGLAAVRPAEFIILRFMHKLQE